MVTKNITFKNSLDEKALFNAWKIVKNDLIKTKKVNFYKINPISKNWFKRVSFLLQSGNYKYSSFDTFHKLDQDLEFVSIRKVKFLIIQFAFINALLPFLKDQSKINLTQHL